MKIGSNDPEMAMQYAQDITDDDEKRSVLNFLKGQAKKAKFRDRLSIQL